MLSIIGTIKKLFNTPKLGIINDDTLSYGDDHSCHEDLPEFTLKLTADGKIIVLDENGRPIEPMPQMEPIPATEVLRLETLNVLFVRQNPCYVYIQTSGGWIRRQVRCP